MRLRLVAATALTALIAAGCGSAGTTASSTSLKPRLLTAIPGLQLERSLDWSNPVDLVGEGVFLPQATHPSQAVTEFKNAGYTGGAGVAFTPAGQPGPESIEGVAKLGSPAKAANVLAYMHRQDLTSPCFSQCTIGAQNLAVPGIPGLKGVVQVQQPPPGTPAPPKGVRIGPSPSTYLAEFAVGPYVYFARTQAIPAEQQRFIDALKAAYARAKAAG